MERPIGRTGAAVREVALHRYALPYRRPVRWQGGVEDHAEFLLLRLTDEDGREGVAEVVAKPTWNGFDGATMALAFERLVLPTLSLAAGERAAALSRLVEMHAPKALLENALADLASAGTRPPVPVSLTLTRASPAAMAAEAAERVGRHGFTVLKVKGGQGTETDMTAVEAVRRAAGGEVAVYVDVNGVLPYDEAADYLRAMAGLGVLAVEDPYNLKPDPRLTALQAGADLPVIADFALDGVSAAAAFLALGVRGLSVKVSRFGMRKALEIGRLAARAGALTVAGLFGESQAGAVHVLDLHAALPADRIGLPAEATAFLLMAEHVLKEPLALADGRLTVPPGNLAAMIDWTRAARFAVAPAQRWTVPA
ncbi:mandelate racemase/muconate lactonizing enzyme family protein [Azospirillum sp. ST 5-10]|uniref:mandelate racemase/muconate lactonizing enzyme family protein n=1 Tax=unclassified Azospirillum TaxID=2630922 RepID=UPI003F4A2EBD